MVAMAIQAYFGIPKENIEVEMTMLGGGFGRRACIDFVLEAAQIAHLNKGTPVQVVWSREDDMTMGYYRPQGACKMTGSDRWVREYTRRSQSLGFSVAVSGDGRAAGCHFSKVHS